MYTNVIKTNTNTNNTTTTNNNNNNNNTKLSNVIKWNEKIIILIRR
jgi:hypothetical protein